MVYRSWRYKDKTPIIPIRASPSWIREILGMALPLIFSDTKSHILIENPEANYTTQILLAIALYGLANTNSDVFALTLAYLEEFDIDDEKIFTLIDELHKLQNFTISKNQIKDLISISVKFYYCGQNDTTEVEPSEVLKNVPSITDTVDVLASWAMQL